MKLCADLVLVRGYEGSIMMNREIQDHELTWIRHWKVEERMVEDTGIEPVTPCMPCKYSPS